MLLALVVDVVPPDDLRLPERRRFLHREPREPRRRTPSLVAGASLLVDYILTVAVSVSRGRARDHVDSRSSQALDERSASLLCLAIIAFITLANLRGIKESGRIFAFPTYVYIFMLTALVVPRA